MNRPSFFIVGAAKCATTALYETLRKHPGVFLPHCEDPERYWLHKEPFHFCSDLGIAEWLRVVNDDDYLKLFEEAPEDAICGTATAWKIFSEEAPSRIKEFAPDAKIVIMLRPPVTWMRSWHHDLLRHGYENKVSFREALEEEAARAEGKNLPRRNAFGSCLSYRKAAHFSEQVERYFATFGRENVFVGLMEDIENDGAAFLKNLLEFLGVDSSHIPAMNRENDSAVLRGTHHFDLAVGRVVSRLPGGEALKRSFEKRLQGRYHSFVDGIFAPMSDKKIESILEEELLEEFEPEVKKLGALLNRDLSHWNEPRFPRSEHDDHHDHHHHH